MNATFWKRWIVDRGLMFEIWPDALLLAYWFLQQQFAAQNPGNGVLVWHRNPEVLSTKV